MSDLLADYNGRTVAVTGAGGYIGSAVVALLVERGARVIRVSSRALQPLMGTKSLNGDICSEPLWDAIVEQADIIIHLAGNTSVRVARDDPAASVSSTLLPVACLVKAARKSGKVPRAVFASTATVYGADPVLPVREDASINVLTLYDLHKWCAERQLQLATEQGLVNGVSLRVSNVYGPSRATSSASDRGILNLVASRALAGKPIAIFGEGVYLRDYVYITDVASAFAVAGIANGVVGHSFNIGNGVGVSFKEAFLKIATQANKVSGVPVHVEYQDWPPQTDPIEFRNYIANIEKYAECTGWRPLIDFDKGVDLTLEQFFLLDGSLHAVGR